jgi:hypothetical protein
MVFVFAVHCWLQPPGLGLRLLTAASVEGAGQDSHGIWDMFFARSPAEHLSSTTEKAMVSVASSHRYTPLIAGQTGSLDSTIRFPFTTKVPMLFHPLSG